MLPLHPELIVQLKDWIAFREKEGASPHDKLFDVPRTLCQIMAIDLAYAGIEKRDALDRVIDVHALRHTHATILAKQGVPITVIQKSMRHADLRQTMRYTHTELENVSDGIGKLPSFLKQDDDQDGTS
jgi:integrase